MRCVVGNGHTNVGATIPNTVGNFIHAADRFEGTAFEFDATIGGFLYCVVVCIGHDRVLGPVQRAVGDGEVVIISAFNDSFFTRSEA